MMVEAGGTEATWRLYEEGAPKVTEEVIADGLEAAKQWIKASIDLQQELARRGRPGARPDRRRSPTRSTPTTTTTCSTRSPSRPPPTRREAMAIADKTERNDRLDEILEGLLLALCGTPDEPGPVPARAKQIKPAFRSLQKQVVRSRIVNEGLRIDGRGTTDIRPLSAEVGLLPTVARLRPVPAGRDPGAQRAHARHAPHGAVHRPRRAPRHHEALHPPLQLPALLHR